MPYKAGKRLAAEKASKLGHLEVINSPLVSELISLFEKNTNSNSTISCIWNDISTKGQELKIIFAVDGSKQTIRSDLPPYKEVSFIKTALLRLDQQALSKLDQSAPHPMALRDIMAKSAMYHATALPLKGLHFEGQNNYHTIRGIIYESLRDNSLNSEPFKTLKWLAYRKWDLSQQLPSPNFECPHCEKQIPGLPYDSDIGICPECKGDLYLSDMIGFHLEMGDDAAPDSVATAYMLIHETLFLFTGIRYFWEANKLSLLAQTLFIKDGPLALHGQYSKLVIPIREFFEYTKNNNIRINVVGQEKTGAFVDHLETIAKFANPNTFFLPNNDYIRREIQHRPERSEPYGSRTNYGNKIFIKLNKHHHMVLSIPTGYYKDSESADDLIGFNDIIGTLPKILSHKHECGLVPIELANGIASLSTYPSANILKLFADF